MLVCQQGRAISVSNAPPFTRSIAEKDRETIELTAACRSVPLSHETYGRAGPQGVALLKEIAENAAGIKSVS